MNIALSTLSPAKRVAKFNSTFPVGTRVAYWRELKQGPPSGKGKTSTKAELLGEHTAVVWIDGCSGCIALSHVEVFPGSGYGRETAETAKKVAGEK